MGCGEVVRVGRDVLLETPFALPYVYTHSRRSWTRWAPKGWRALVLDNGLTAKLGCSTRDHSTGGTVPPPVMMATRRHLEVGVPPAGVLCAESDVYSPGGPGVFEKRAGGGADHLVSDAGGTAGPEADE